MSFTLSPNMSLPIPGVGTEASPTYAFDINSALTIVDGHNHTPGSGVQITPQGININTSFTFNNNLATNLQGTVFALQASNSSTSGTVYTKLGTEPTPLQDLFYFDGSNVVQLTAGGNVNATAANIPGESYAGGTFTWVQGTGSTVPANFDIGSITIRPNVAATTNGVTVTPPSAISSAYNLALPTIPLATSFLQIDTSGNISPGPAISGGITSSNIAAGTITGGVGGNIASSTIDTTNIATTNLVQSPTCGTFNASGTSSVTITSFSISINSAAGKPFEICVVPDGFGGISTMFVAATTLSSSFAIVSLIRDSTLIGQQTIGGTVQGSPSSQLNYPPSSLSFIDIPAAGFHNYTMQVATTSSSVQFTISNCRLTAYEIL